MLRLVFKRLIVVVPLALGVATLIFVLMETAPGDPVDVLIGERPVPPEIRERIERAYGLDRSPVERYVHWLDALCLHGDLGWSHSRSRPVSAVLAETLPRTMLLAGAALLLHLLVGIVLGVLSAAYRDRWPDTLVTLGSLTLYAMPAFWLGLMAILGLSYLVPAFPASSIQSVGAEGWPLWSRLVDRLWHLALPAGVLGLASAAAMTRFVRSGLLRTLGGEFVRAARARGLGGSRVLWGHALRNALLPVVNLVGLSLPVLFSGSLVIEVVFAWPGMGRLTYEAIRAHDMPVVLAATLLVTGMVLLGSLAADLAMAVADPRIRIGAAAERS